MKRFSRGDKGFTLVELLIVVAILGVLASVVIPSVLGLMGRGSAQAYETDEEVIQTVVAAFHTDVHGGCIPDKDDPDLARWNAANNTNALSPGHYYPTAIAVRHDHVLYANLDAEHPSNDGSYELWNGGAPATDPDISAHAIWMGLLVNDDGTGPCESVVPDTCEGTDDRALASPLDGEIALYLQEMPASADDLNGNPDPGSYCWIVGENGTVYGAYEDGGIWYTGPGPGYP